MQQQQQQGTDDANSDLSPAEPQGDSVSINGYQNSESSSRNKRKRSSRPEVSTECPFGMESSVSDFADVLRHSSYDLFQEDYATIDSNRISFDSAVENFGNEHFDFDFPRHSISPQLIDPALSLEPHFLNDLDGFDKQTPQIPISSANHHFNTQNTDVLNRPRNLNVELTPIEQDSRRRLTYDQNPPDNRVKLTGEENHASDAKERCVRRLSKLSIDLYEHGRTVPPQSIHVNDDTPFDDSAPYLSFSIDNTFRLTQSLIDIYPACIDAFTQPSLITISEQSNSEESGEFRQKISSNTLSSITHLDNPSILLLLSCHMRLIDIFEEIIKHFHTSIAQRGTPPNPKQAALTTPALRIGTYVLPRSVAISMQMLLLVQLGTQLSEHAQNLWTHIEPAYKDQETSTGMNTGVCALSLTTAETVKRRADSMAMDLRDIKVLMDNTGFYC